MSLWDPTTWWGDFTAAVGGAASDAIRAIGREVIKAVNLLSNDISSVASSASAMFHSVSTEVDNVASEITRTAVHLGGDISNAVGQAESDAKGWVDDAAREAWRGIDTAYRTAVNVGADAHNFAHSVVQGFWHDVIDPAYQVLVHQVDDFAAAGRAVAGIVQHDHLSSLRHDLEEAMRLIHDIRWWVDHTGYDTVHLVEHAADWIEWFAKNPIKAVETLPHDVAELFKLPVPEKAPPGEHDLFEALLGGVRQVLKMPSEKKAPK